MDTHYVLLVVGFAIAGCGNRPSASGATSCEDAFRAASKVVPSLADPNAMSEGVAACIKYQWSEEPRRCIATVRDEPDLAACYMRYASKSGEAKAVAKMFTESRVDIAKATVKKFAYEAYPSWSATHPEKACPDRIEDLNAYMNETDTKDPWGNPYKIYCGENLPPGAKGLAATSMGEDGKEGTPDDIKSWE